MFVVRAESVWGDQQYTEVCVREISIMGVDGKDESNLVSFFYLSVFCSVRPCW